MTDASPARALGFRPLYLQVKESLVRRLIEGSWQPGQLIPSEMELAREIGVSQGTIRKALNAMTAENLLIRRQGHGTYVAAPEESRILFQFFRLVRDTGERTFPTSRVLSWTKQRAEKEEAEALDIAATASVWRIERVRYLGEDPLIVEYISLPARRFPGFEKLTDIPNNVYRLYSERWGLTIGSGTERIKAIAASAEDARHLGCKRGTPLLRITRVAFDLEHKPVELRISRCLTERAHYLSDLK
ncbi:GntR family transcriptional regulator [Chelativorans intermedius]|uniref:GntR family transcriptional regulator n=1 Tax=Chelativorans intermedius TaxID=515947 RepID=A0ABV6DAN5_9HYPH|nr:GntR family transcriptional regulator [Chelativorans intermedius]MCT9000118.1 GntR family transcriptional regulator [Chelativorans intermedius]